MSALPVHWATEQIDSRTHYHSAIGLAATNIKGLDWRATTGKA